MTSVDRVVRRRRLRVACGIVLLVVLLAGCGDGAGGATTAPATTVTPLAATACGDTFCAAQNVQVFVEPDAGEAPVLHAIEGATASVWVEVYLLTDTNVIHALEDAANRGVDVRVLLELHPYGGGSVSAQKTLAELNAAGVRAQGANPAFRYTHEKAMVIDATTAYIMTCNLSKSGLGGSTSAANREYGVIDTNSQDVAEVAGIFQADWNRSTATYGDPRLVVSPINARSDLAALIAAAHTSLDIEDEEMYDQQSEDAMIAAARRGVTIELVLPAPSSSATGESTDVARLTAGGVHVRYSKAPYMHAKLVVADGATAFVGSENFSSTSLDHNRELGVLIADSTALHILTTTFSHDWLTARDV